jgi:GNAT superfamily N-acetyltransferase
MTINIRPIRPDDEAQWRVLWGAYLEFYETSLPDDIYSATFARLVDADRPHQFGFLAEVDGKAVGLVHVIVHAHNWRLEDVLYLQDLYVAPEGRRTGVGRALIEAVYAAADANATPSVYWLTQGSNASARVLYDRIAKLTPFIKYQR